MSVLGNDVRQFKLAQVIGVVEHNKPFLVSLSRGKPLEKVLHRGRIVKHSISRLPVERDREGIAASLETGNRCFFVSYIEPENGVVSVFVLLNIVKHELSFASTSKAYQGKCMHQCFAAARLLHLGRDLCRSRRTIDVCSYCG